MVEPAVAVILVLVIGVLVFTLFQTGKKKRGRGKSAKKVAKEPPPFGSVPFARNRSPRGDTLSAGCSKRAATYTSSAAPAVESDACNGGRAAAGARRLIAYNSNVRLPRWNL
jgi:hypothetical protein